MKLVRTRQVFQVLFLLFFVFLFLKARYPYAETPDSDLMLRFSPLIPLFDLLSSQTFNLLFWPALLILLITPFLGRFFCGWICPLGTSLDAVSKLVKSPSNKFSVRWHKLTYLKFGLLVAALILAIFSVHIWGYFDPLSIFNRALTIVFYPLSAWLMESGLMGVTELSVLEDPAWYVYDLYKEWIMPENQAFLLQVFPVAIFIGLIFGAEKLSRRFWCRYLCPAGALLGFLSQFRFYERLVGDSCPVCNNCQRDCKMNAIPEGDVGRTDKVECIECFNCGSVCPPKNKSITYRLRWKPYHSPVDFDRRKFVATTAGSLAALGLINIGLKNRSAKSRLIRPPGSVQEDVFLDRCIRCLHCVRICHSNGGCLQADSIHNSVLELWAPAAKMREGYCEYNCNLCGQVCPTEAILPLSLEEKKKTAMGLAYFDKNLCIPYAQNSDCIVCEEHCPTPEKAIQFEVKTVTQTDGSSKAVKYPFVVKELCIGCGICEHKCPLPGEPGVFVVSENEQRLEV